MVRCRKFTLLCAYLQKPLDNWFGGSVVDLTGVFGSPDKEFSVASLCAGELEERFPYWDNMHCDLWPCSEAVVAAAGGGGGSGWRVSLPRNPQKLSRLSK